MQQAKWLYRSNAAVHFHQPLMMLSPDKIFYYAHSEQNGLLEVEHSQELC